MRIREERENARLSLRQLAKLAGVPHSTLARWEAGAGRRGADGEALKAIASALGVTVARLCGESPAQQIAAAS